MAATFILAAAALGLAIPADTTGPNLEPVDVAYGDLSAGKAQEAIEQIEANDALETNDPARLINLGTAYASMGNIEKARTLYQAAAKNSEEVILETADGRWLSSRRIARQALSQLDKSPRIAMR